VEYRLSGGKPSFSSETFPSLAAEFHLKTKNREDGRRGSMGFNNDLFERGLYQSLAWSEKGWFTISHNFSVA
jgi:hypothetical protein